MKTHKSFPPTPFSSVKFVWFHCSLWAAQVYMLQKFGLLHIYLFPPNTQLLGKLLASTYRKIKITLCKWQIKIQHLLIAEKSLKTCMFSGSGIPELHSSHSLLSYGTVLPREPAPVTWTGVSQNQRAQHKIPGCKYHWTTLKWAHFWLCLKHPLKG